MHLKGFQLVLFVFYINETTWKIGAHGGAVGWGIVLQVCRADNLTIYMCWLSWNLGELTSCNHHGLSKPVQGLLYLYIVNYQDFQTQVVRLVPYSRALGSIPGDFMRDMWWDRRQQSMFLSFFNFTLQCIISPLLHTGVSLSWCVCQT